MRLVVQELRQYMADRRTDYTQQAVHNAQQMRNTAQQMQQNVQHMREGLQRDEG
jgi:hypothetical protein